MKKIGGKLFIAFLCMSLLIVGLLWLIQAVLMKDSYLNERVKTIDNALQIAAQNAEIDYQALEAGMNLSLIHTDVQGGIRYTSQGLPMRGMLTRQLPAIMSQSENGKLAYIQNASMNMRYAFIGRALTDGGRLFALFSLADVEEASRILLQQLWVITAVLFVISLALSLILARMFARPIRKVTQAAHEIANGNLDIRLPVRTKDEIGRLTEALNGLVTELQKTETLRRELIANVSHELRSPLAVIQGFAETVRDVTWPDQEKREQQLTIISDEALRLNRIVNDILDYSRLQAGVDRISISVFSLCPLLSEVIQRYELEAERKNLKLILACPDLKVRFDQNKLNQVITNLLDNALNHAQAGTAIHINASQHQNRARISVKNSGKGIPPEEINQIWDRYYRAEQMNNNKPMGTGLGLSIVKSILELHNVPYGVISENNETKFWFETM